MVRIDKAQMTPDEIPTKKKPSEGLEDQGCKIKTNKAITNWIKPTRKQNDFVLGMYVASNNLSNTSTTEKSMALHIDNEIQTIRFMRSWTYGKH